LVTGISRASRDLPISIFFVAEGRRAFFVKLDHVPPMDAIQRLSARRKILDGREFLSPFLAAPRRAASRPGLGRSGNHV